MSDESDNVTPGDKSERLDEKPRHVLNELVGILQGHQLDRDPPISETEDGELEGLEIAINELQFVMENGDVRPMTDSSNQPDDSHVTPDPDTERCDNCNTSPQDHGKGHSYRETADGIEYNVEHLNDLGLVRANGIFFMFDRTNNRLVIEREEWSLQEIVEELQRKVATDGDWDE